MLPERPKDVALETLVLIPDPSAASRQNYLSRHVLFELIDGDLRCPGKSWSLFVSRSASFRCSAVKT